MGNGFSRRFLFFVIELRFWEYLKICARFEKFEENEPPQFD
jgi:hypothetical protein